MVLPEAHVAFAKGESVARWLDELVGVAHVEILTAAKGNEESQHHELVEDDERLGESGVRDHLFDDAEGER